MTAPDWQEQPYSEWLEQAEMASDAGWDWGKRQRALRELRARDAEIASLKARVAELEQEKESIYRDAEKGMFG